MDETELRGLSDSIEEPLDEMEELPDELRDVLREFHTSRGDSE